MRLIDGDALIHEYYKNPTYQNLCNAINSATTIEPMQWIPCSERNPDKEGFYLATCVCWGGDLKDAFVDFAEWCDGDWEEYYKVIAWQPKPEPYKGGDAK